MSIGKSFQSIGAMTEKALKPYVFNNPFIRPITNDISRTGHGDSGGSTILL